MDSTDGMIIARLNGKLRCFRWSGDRIQWSNSEPEEWFPSDNWVAVGRVDGVLIIEKVIKGTVPDTLIIHTNRGMYQLTGDPEAPNATLFHVLPQDEDYYRQDQSSGKTDKRDLTTDTAGLGE